jgi:taurine dioxygenase
MMDIEALLPGFVAEVRGVDLRALDDETFELLYAAWLEFGVLRLRDQALEEEHLEQFSARFGPLEEIPMGNLPPEKRAKIKNRYVTRISNILVDGRPIGGLGNAEANWHSDMTYVETPPPASVLLGVEIPAEGGDTFFADQCAALEALPEDLRQRLEGVRIKHDAAHTSVGGLRAGFEAFDDPRDAPGAVHPAVLTHPETGRPALYLGRREWASVPGLSLEDSEALLDEVWQHAARPPYVWKQEWRPGDVIIWDNRRVLHRRDGFDQNARRMLKRCQVLAREAV